MVSGKRNRSREGAGESSASYIKHNYLRQPVFGQAFSYRQTHPQDAIVLVDGNAGDGNGVPQAQLDLFGENLSCATPALLVGIAQKIGNCNVLLCEKDRSRRGELRVKFPNITVIDNHENVAELVNGYRYGIWLGDPCGPASQGMDAMRRFGSKLRSDFVVTYNAGFVEERLAGVKSGWEKAQQLYLPLSDPDTWLRHLSRSHMSRTPVINASASFRYRILVITNWLSDAAKRRPFEVVR